MPVNNESTIYLSIVIPCYNEESAVESLYAEIKKIFESINKQIEFIFIDDGSVDNTLEILKKLADRDVYSHYISFSRNFGKEAAILAGLEEAGGEYTVVMDADGQDPPSLIPEMLQAVACEEYDCSGSRRVNRIGEPVVRSFFSKLFYKIIKKATDLDIVDGARDFRLMNRKYKDALLTLKEKNRFSKGIFPWIGFKIKWFEYENIKRKSGKTKWSFWNLFKYSMDGIIGFSSKPLAAASFLGVLFFIISIIIIVFIIIRKIVWGDPVSGWASTVCIILFCSGVQLFTAGILGQYIAKIFTEVKQRPHFIIKDKK